MTVLKTRFSWLMAPAMFVVAMFILISIGATHSMEWITRYFNQNGLAPVEIMAVTLFVAIIPIVWLVPPFANDGAREKWLKLNFSLLAFMAVCRELDWHKMLITPSNLPGATTGTPFKMRFLTNSVNPLSDRLLVLAIFILFFVIVGVTLIYCVPRLWKGFWRMNPVAWTIAWFGGTTSLVLIADRLPAECRHAGHALPEGALTILMALEEGLEVLMPTLLILAIVQAHFIYAVPSDDDCALERFRAA